VFCIVENNIRIKPCRTGTRKVEEGIQNYQRFISQRRHWNIWQWLRIPQMF